MKRLLFFPDAVAFSFWHHFGKPHGTAIRFLKMRPGLFGIFYDGGIKVGFWKNYRIELVAVHVDRFKEGGAK